MVVFEEGAVTDKAFTASLLTPFSTRTGTPLSSSVSRTPHGVHANALISPNSRGSFVQESPPSVERYTSPLTLLA